MSLRQILYAAAGMQAQPAYAEYFALGGANSPSIALYKGSGDGAFTSIPSPTSIPSDTLSIASPSKKRANAG